MINAMLGRSAELEMDNFEKVINQLFVLVHVKRAIINFLARFTEAKLLFIETYQKLKRG